MRRLRVIGCRWHEYRGKSGVLVRAWGGPDNLLEIHLDGADDNLLVRECEVLWL